MSKLLLAEHDYQVEDFIKRGLDKNAVWIALGPYAMYYLSKKSIPFTIPEDYCELKEIEVACINQFEKIKKVCNDLDAIILSKDPFLRKWDIRPFLFNCWLIKLIMDGLLGRTIWLKNILNHYPEYKVFVHLAPAQKWEPFDFCFSQKETLWGRLLSLQGWKHKIITLPNPKNKDNKQNNGNFLLSVNRIIKQYPILANLAKSYKYGYLLNEIKMLCSFNNKDSILVNTVGEWGYLFEELGKKYKIVFMNYKNDNLQNKKLNKETESLCELFEKEFNTEHINYASLIRDRISFVIENSPIIADKIIKKMEKYCSLWNIRAMLNSTSVCFSELVAKNFCQINNIPVLQWQHGAVWYDNFITQNVDFFDMLNTSVLLTYGDSVTEGYKTSIFNETCKVVSVGSIKLDRLSKNSEVMVLKNHNNKQIKILYPLTGYYGNNWYCGWSPPFDDSLYYKAQVNLINRLKQMVSANENLSLTIKLYSSGSLYDIPPWVEDLRRVERIYFKNSGLFYNLLKEHEIVLIDSPTTVLLEAIATKKPVFVYTSIICPPRMHLPILKKRVVCEDNINNLMDKLEKYVKTCEYPADVNNREYVKLYGTCIDDGKSLTRALRTLEGIINEKQNRK